MITDLFNGKSVGVEGSTVRYINAARDVINVLPRLWIEKLVSDHYDGPFTLKYVF